MTTVSEVTVTLSDELIKHLIRRAARMKVSIEWLVAGLVCDTIERFADGCARGSDESRDLGFVFAVPSRRPGSH